MNKPSPVTTIPTKRERAGVEKTLQTVKEQEFDQVLILGWKDGRTFMHHSYIENTLLTLGALENLKFRLQE